MTGIFNNRAIRLLSGALDGLASRQSAISSNIANAETPGYERRDVAFEQQLRSAVDRGEARLAGAQPGHVTLAGSSRSRLLDDPQTASILSARNDGNTVDVEREMTDLAETTIRYYAVADVLKSKMSTLRQIIERS